MRTRHLFCDILHPPPPRCAEAQTWQTIVMPAYFLMILHFSISSNTGYLTTSSEEYSSPKTEGAVADLPPSAKWTLPHLLHFWQLCSPLCCSLLHLGWVLRDLNHFLLFHMSCDGADTFMSLADKKQSPHQTCCSSPAIPGGWAWYLQVSSMAWDTLVWDRWIHLLQPGQLKQLWESYSLLLPFEHCKCGRRGIKLQLPFVKR